MTHGTADFEQRSSPIEVHSHPEIEIRFGLAADDGSEMEDRGGLSRDDLLEQRAVGNVAGHLHDA